MVLFASPHTYGHAQCCIVRPASRFPFRHVRDETSGLACTCSTSGTSWTTVRILPLQSISVTWEDQERICKFNRLNTSLHELDAQLKKQQVRQEGACSQLPEPTSKIERSHRRPIGHNRQQFLHGDGTSSASAAQQLCSSTQKQVLAFGCSHWHVRCYMS